MKRLLFLLMFLAVPLKAQFSGVYIGEGDYGFFVDTIGPKIEPARPWIFELKAKDPSVIVGMYNTLAQCEGLDPKDSFKRITFYSINSWDFGGAIVDGHPVTFAGYTLPHRDGTFSIYLSEYAQRSPPTVRHEMLHVLLAVGGFKMGHPAPYFDRKDCGVVR